MLRLRPARSWRAASLRTNPRLSIAPGRVRRWRGPPCRDGSARSRRCRPRRRDGGDVAHAHRHPLTPSLSWWSKRRSPVGSRMARRRRHAVMGDGHGDGHVREVGGEEDRPALGPRNDDPQVGRDGTGRAGRGAPLASPDQSSRPSVPQPDHGRRSRSRPSAVSPTSARRRNRLPVPVAGDAADRAQDRPTRIPDVGDLVPADLDLPRAAASRRRVRFVVAPGGVARARAETIHKPESTGRRDLVNPPWRPP